MDDMDITIYFVGTDEDDAKANLIFDSYDSAQDYQSDNPGTEIFSASATIDLSTFKAA